MVNFDKNGNTMAKDGVNSITWILTTEPVQSPSLPLKGVNNIHGGHRLPPRVLSVRHSIANNVLQEDLQNASGLLVDQPADPLHSTSSCKTPDSRLSDSLNVITENFPMTLRSSLTEPLASFSTTWHCTLLIIWESGLGFWFGEEDGVRWVGLEI